MKGPAIQLIYLIMWRIVFSTSYEPRSTAPLSHLMPPLYRRLPTVANGERASAVISTWLTPLPQDRPPRHQTPSIRSPTPGGGASIYFCPSPVALVVKAGRTMPPAFLFARPQLVRLQPALFRSAPHSGGKTARHPVPCRATENITLYYISEFLRTVGERE